MILGADYYRAHGLGNDYLVFEGAAQGEEGWMADPETLRRVCHRGEGVGSDGVVVLLDRRPADGVFPLRMFNPDGSEFERSGNGLRILGAFLHSRGWVGEAPFQVRSGGSRIEMQVHARSAEGVLDLSVQMGRATLGAAAVEWQGGPDSIARDSLSCSIPHPTLGGVTFFPVSVGNPHAVVFADALHPGRVEALGSFLAKHPSFSRGTNVQLACVDSEGGEGTPGVVRIEIWERGVGRTSASGTSSCAVAVAAVATGRCSPGALKIQMEGGTLEVGVTPDLEVTLRGPVQEVSEGRLAPGFVRALNRGR